MDSDVFLLIMQIQFCRSLFCGRIPKKPDRVGKRKTGSRYEKLSFEQMESITGSKI